MLENECMYHYYCTDHKFSLLCIYEAIVLTV